MKWGIYSKLHVVLQSLEIAVLIKEHICWKVKIRTESNRGNKCIDVRQSDYHFADRDKLYEATNQGFGRQFNVPTHIELLVCSFLSLSKAKENSMGVQEKEQLWFFFYIDCKTAQIWTPHYCSPRVPPPPPKKNPGHLFVVKVYGRVNSIKVMSNQSVNLLGSQMRSNKRIFLNTRFQDRSTRIYN